LLPTLRKRQTRAESIADLAIRTGLDLVLPLHSTRASHASPVEGIHFRAGVLHGENRALGPADADRWVIEFTDFVCGHCRAGHDRVMEPLLLEWFGPRDAEGRPDGWTSTEGWGPHDHPSVVDPDGHDLNESPHPGPPRVPLRVESVPVAFLSQDSMRAAHAALCAQEQHKYWEVRDLLFQVPPPPIHAPAHGTTRGRSDGGECKRDGTGTLHCGLGLYGTRGHPELDPRPLTKEQAAAEEAGAHGAWGGRDRGHWRVGEAAERLEREEAERNEGEALAWGRGRGGADDGDGADDDGGAFDVNGDGTSEVGGGFDEGGADTGGDLSFEHQTTTSGPDRPHSMGHRPHQGLGHRPSIFTGAVLRHVAEVAGLDIESFLSCHASQRHRDEVEALSRLAADLGVHGTPSFLVGPGLLPNKWERQAMRDHHGGVAGFQEKHGTDRPPTLVEGSDAMAVDTVRRALSLPTVGYHMLMDKGRLIHDGKNDSLRGSG